VWTHLVEGVDGSFQDAEFHSFYVDLDQSALLDPEVVDGVHTYRVVRAVRVVFVEFQTAEIVGLDKVEFRHV